MARDEGMRVVGTIRSIELHSLGAGFAGVAPRQVAKIQLDVERATDEDGADIAVENVAAVHFQGPAELVPRFTAGERVQIVTLEPGDLHIASIRRAPLS
ncbi:MAG: hypothetical protein R2939_20805 [Kofleriaceae bacterium]